MDYKESVELDMNGMVQQSLGKPLDPGTMGVVLARAGVGKTACLTHIALEHLLQGHSVLHVCIEETPDTIKVWYQELLKSIARSRSLDSGDVEKLLTQVEPRRFILAYLYRTFSPEKLGESLLNLKEQAQFNTSMVVLDGLDFDHVTHSTLEALHQLVKHHGVSMWVSARTHRHIDTVNEHGIPYPCHQVDDLFQAILLLEPSANVIRLKVLKLDDRYQPEQSAVSLDPQTFLLKKD